MSAAVPTGALCEPRRCQRAKSAAVAAGAPLMLSFELGGRIAARVAFHDGVVPVRPVFLGDQQLTDTGEGRPRGEREGLIAASPWFASMPLRSTLSPGWKLAMVSPFAAAAERKR